MLIDDIKKREIGVFEAFGIGKLIYKENMKQILNVALFIGVPVNILLNVVLNSFSNVAMGVNMQAILTDTNILNQFMASNEWKSMVAYYFILILVQAMVLPLISMSVARMTKDYMCGTPVNSTKAMLESFQKGAVLIMASFVHELMVGCGMTLFILPGLYLYVLLYFYIYTIMLDDKGPMASLRESARLVKGYFGKTAIAVMLIYSVSYSISYIVNMIFGFAGGNLVAGVISRTIITIIDCFFVAGTTVYYLNRKAIKDEEAKSFNGFQ